MKAALSAVDPKKVKGIGISGQQHGFVPLDKRVAVGFSSPQSTDWFQFAPAAQAESTRRCNSYRRSGCNVLHSLSHALAGHALLRQTPKISGLIKCLGSNGSLDNSNGRIITHV